MGIFDYKNYSTTESAALVSNARDLAVYTNAKAFFRLPGADILNTLGKLGKDFLSNEVDISIPKGWRELEPADLGLPDDIKDNYGYLTFESPYLGKVDNGPQAKVFAQEDADGKVVKVALGWCGTNGLVDIVDYWGVNNNDVVPPMEPLLMAIKEYAEANGLSGEDILVTGYSLGGGLVNSMAEMRATVADGFFIDSDYIGVESPTVYNEDNVVLNVGFENDVVFRVAGDHESFGDALKAGGPFLLNHNHNYDSSMDNFVLFNDMYATGLWNISPFSLLNLPAGWYAHMDGVITDAVDRVIDSSFYDLTVRDSTVVVSSLTALSRGIQWVEDKSCATSNHYGSPAFLIGTKHADKIRGGENIDYIDAGAGDDLIEAGRGYDRVDGGTGVDNLRLVGRSEDWHVCKLSDDTLMFASKEGADFVEATNIEQISFTGEVLSWTRPYEIGEDGLIDHRFKLFSFFNNDEAYQEVTEGSDGNDTLTGNIIFARGGDDILYAADGGALLHGGEGNDILHSGSGNDRLYGAEGDDILIVHGGENILSGGIGNDQFVFTAETSGKQVITDFNQFIQDKDTVLFDHNLIADQDTLHSLARQEGKDVVIETDTFSLQVLNSELDDLLSACVIIA